MGKAIRIMWGSLLSQKNLEERGQEAKAVEGPKGAARDLKALPVG